MRKLELTDEMYEALTDALDDAYAYREGEASGLDDPALDENDRVNMVRYAALMEDLDRQADPLTAPTKTYSHDPRPDDDPEPGNRCKDCGDDITWQGPSQHDWIHVDDARNR